MRTVLALDLGTTTGWATDRDDRVAFGHFCVAKKDDCKAERLVLFRDELDRLVVCYKPTVIAYENACVQRGHAAQWWAQWEAIVLLTAADMRVACFHVHPSTLKKFVTGRGNAPKNEMINWAKVYAGAQDLTHDEADAVAVLHWARERTVTCPDPEGNGNEPSE